MNKQKIELASDYGKITQMDNSSIVSIINGPNGKTVIVTGLIFATEIVGLIMAAMIMGYSPTLNIGNASLTIVKS